MLFVSDSYERRKMVHNSDAVNVVTYLPEKTVKQLECQTLRKFYAV